MFAVILAWLFLWGMVLVGTIVLLLSGMGYVVSEGRPRWRVVCLTGMIMGAILTSSGFYLVMNPSGFGGIPPKPAEKAPDVGQPG
ncbi:MAG: hypothetical protein Q7U20_04940 [Caulobacter sp.]|nr:hypothetical protein [Caulobacter sp.]